MSRFPNTITIHDHREGIYEPIKVRFEAETRLDAESGHTLRKVTISDEGGTPLGTEWINRHARPNKTNALPLAKSHTSAPPLLKVEVAFYVTASLFPLSDPTSERKEPQLV